MDNIYDLTGKLNGILIYCNSYLNSLKTLHSLTTKNELLLVYVILKKKEKVHCLFSLSPCSVFLSECVVKCSCFIMDY